jgi:hypothetical protein
MVGMPASGWLTVPADAIAASILLFAACAKLVSPDALARSLNRLTSAGLGGRVSSAGHAVVRAIAVAEVVVAFGVLIEPIRFVASALLCLLGLSFAALGVLGRVRRVDEPCGCFGAASQQPLGIQNIVFGLLFTLIGVANLVTADQLTDDVRAAPPLLAAGLLCSASVITGRSLLRTRQSKPEHG